MSRWWYAWAIFCGLLGFASMAFIVWAVLQFIQIGEAVAK